MLAKSQDSVHKPPFLKRKDSFRGVLYTLEASTYQAQKNPPPRSAPPPSAPYTAFIFYSCLCCLYFVYFIVSVEFPNIISDTFYQEKATAMELRHLAHPVWAIGHPGPTFRVSESLSLSLSLVRACMCVIFCTVSPDLHLGETRLTVAN